VPVYDARAGSCQLLVLDLDPARGHVLRYTFGTRLIRDGYDLVLAAELMGYARTETTRGYSLPTADDAQAAINSHLADR
jgi:site-specific recombinase XerD